MTSPQTHSADSPTKPDGFDALPRRFKQYIQQLASEVSALRAMTEQEGQTRVAIKSYSTTGEQLRYLKNEITIRFFAKNGKSIDVRLDERHGCDGVEISTSNGRIVVRPEVTNVITVVVGDL